MKNVFCSWSSLSGVVWVALLSISLTQACYIRNCPRGGKRSMDTQMATRKQCMSCGPEGEGQCVGPRICCSQKFGCLFGTRSTQICQEEDDSDTPCYVTGKTCGAYDLGNCVADGICCDSESCAMNDRCLVTDSEQPHHSREEVLSLVEQLLRKSKEQNRS